MRARSIKLSMLSMWLALLGVIAALVMGAGAVHAQTRPSRGAIVALRGTPHLWIADSGGVLHWAGDTRALSGRFVDWSNRQEVSVDELKAMSRGEPWLSAGLLKSGDPIYFVKWESDWAEPQLLHIQSIADVELFGIDGSNYGQMVFDEAAWERRFGKTASRLQKGTLQAAVQGAASQPSSPAYDSQYEGAIVTSCTSDCNNQPDKPEWYLTNGQRRLLPDIETWYSLYDTNGGRYYKGWAQAAIDRIPRGADLPSGFTVGGRTAAPAALQQAPQLPAGCGNLDSATIRSLQDQARRSIQALQASLGTVVGYDNEIRAKIAQYQQWIAEGDACLSRQQPAPIPVAPTGRRGTLPSFAGSTTACGYGGGIFGTSGPSRNAVEDVRSAWSGPASNAEINALIDRGIAGLREVMAARTRARYTNENEQRCIDWLNAVRPSR